MEYMMGEPVIFSRMEKTFRLRENGCSLVDRVGCSGERYSPSRQSAVRGRMGHLVSRRYRQKQFLALSVAQGRDGKFFLWKVEEVRVRRRGIRVSSCRAGPGDGLEQRLYGTSPGPGRSPVTRLDR